MRVRGYGKVEGIREHNGPVAQLGARFHGMEEVVSSNLTRSTKTSRHSSRLTNKYRWHFGCRGNNIGSMNHSAARHSAWSRILLSVLFTASLGGQTLPSLGGAWTSAGRSAFISQDAGGRLVFTNEYGQKSSGSFANATTVIATEWEGGLRGALQDNGNTIRWANGTAWVRTAAASSSVSSPESARSLTGLWKIWANWAGEDRALRLQLTQSGNRLHGVVLGTNQPIEGTVNGRAVEFSRSGGGLAVPQVYKGFLFAAGSPLTMAGIFSHNNESNNGWYGYLEK